MINTRALSHLGITFPLSLIGYSKEQKMIFIKLVGDKDIDLLIAEIFETKSDVEYLHARNSEACCFICKIERVKLDFEN